MYIVTEGVKRLWQMDGRYGYGASVPYLLLFIVSYLSLFTLWDIF